MLVGLAIHAGPDGTGAFPSVATPVRYTSLSERTVRTCLDRLEPEGIITPCTPGIIAARIKRADRRPQGWNLNLHLVRDEPGEPSEATAEPRPSASQGLLTERLRRARTGPVDNRLGGVRRVHPAAGTGCNERPNGCNLRRYGVQRLHPNHPSNRPPPQRAPARRQSATRRRAAARPERGLSASPHRAGARM